MLNIRSRCGCSKVHWTRGIRGVGWGQGGGNTLYLNSKNIHFIAFIISTCILWISIDVIMLAYTSLFIKMTGMYATGVSVNQNGTTSTVVALGAMVWFCNSCPTVDYALLITRLWNWAQNWNWKLGQGTPKHTETVLGPSVETWWHMHQTPRKDL